MTTDQILTRFTQRSAVVIGDICLDRWCTYDPSTAEPSRETGIPRIGVISTDTSPGAGGTVANNLAALGVGKVAVLGVIGQDGSPTTPLAGPAPLPAGSHWTASAGSSHRGVSS